MKRLWLLVLLGFGSAGIQTARAARPDGLDCDRHPQIPPARCSEWKSFNGQGRWWCNWNLATGKIDALYGSQGNAISPGLDLRRITGDSARSDTATRELLEAYSRQQIRQRESLFGFDPQGYELLLLDFHFRHGGTRRLVREDGSIEETALPAVASIHLAQIVRQVRVLGAEIQLQVDEQNRLVSFESTFLTDPPQNPPRHRIGEDEAIAAALAAAAPGVSRDSGRVGAERAYRIEGLELRPVHQVSLMFPESGIARVVLVDARDATILESSDEASGIEFGGHRSVPGRVVPRHPPFEERPTSADSFETILDADGSSPADFSAALENVDLRHVEDASPLRLKGYFARVSNAEQDSWDSATGELVPPRDEFVMQVDLLSSDDTGSGCEDDASASEPRMIVLGNEIFESRFDEMSAYYHVTNAGEHFLTRHRYQLGSSENADPQILTLVNSRYKDDDVGAFFTSGCVTAGTPPKTECLPQIHFLPGKCWRLLSRGDDVPFVLPDLGTATADYYSWRDTSRDRDVAWHEFTHAVQWDIIGIANQHGGEEFGKAGSAFKEAIADFFPASIFGDSLFAAWPNADANPGRELDPFRHPAVGRPEEVDLAWPYDRDPDDDPYANSRIWSGFLWDLRKRAALIEEELGSSRISANVVEDLQFEALFRMPAFVRNFTDPLIRLFDADESVTGSQLTGEIAAMAARHGLKATRSLAAVVPEHYLIESGSGVIPRFIVYAGANHLCGLQLSSDPTFPQEDGDRTVNLECVEPSCVVERISEADDDENLRCRFTVGSAEWAVVSGPDESTARPVFFRATTNGVEGPQTSFVSGGGNTILHPDVPAVFAAPEGAGGCLPVCHVSPRRLAATDLIPLAGLLIVWWQRRRSVPL